MQSHVLESGSDLPARGVNAPVILVVAAFCLFLPGFATLPPMDRDEPRFAQASKQMIETGDLVSIRFGGEARNKKPVGIHWLQAASVAVGEALGVPDARRQIWLYRVPSLLGATAAVVLTYWAALAFLDRMGALAAALLFAATPLLGVEARLATTDAVLVATVTAAMGALARLYLADAETRRRSAGVATAFWVAVGLGILIKGPITPMIAALTSAGLSVKDRSARWLGALRPAWGIALCLLIALPWFVLIVLKTNGAFVREAVGHDLLAKVASGQEAHGAPPGFYFAAFWLAAWPLAPFTALAVPSLWRHRRAAAVAVLAAWVIPTWLVFEAVPTKLVHYALPLYPALAIATVYGLERAVEEDRRFGPAALWAGFGLLALMPFGVAGFIAAGQGRIWTLGPADVLVAAVALSMVLALVWVVRRCLTERRLYRAAGVAAAAAFPLYLYAFGRLLSPDVAGSLDLSRGLGRAAFAALGTRCPHPGFATISYREPSLMFATDRDLLFTDAAGAARFLDEGSCRVVFAERRDTKDFQASLDTAVPVYEAARLTGFALNGGRSLDVGVFVHP